MNHLNMGSAGEVVNTHPARESCGKQNTYQKKMRAACAQDVIWNTFSQPFIRMNVFLKQMLSYWIEVSNEREMDSE